MPAFTHVFDKIGAARGVMLLLSAALLGGCSGSGRQPTNPENEQWFCQSNVAGDGWDCVQDENLARVPVPTRMPPEPAPPASESVPGLADAPAEDIADLSLDPREELARMQAQQAEELAAATPDELAREADARALESAAAAAAAETMAEDAAPAGEAASTVPASGGGRPAAAAAPVTADSAADPAPQALPKHVQLAYVPPEPTPILELPPEYFAVQMLAMSSKELIEAYVAEHELRGMSAARVENEGELYYVLVLGVYTTLARAQEAASDLPPPLDKAEPWIRPLGSLQAAMRRADELAGSARF